MSGASFASLYCCLFLIFQDRRAGLQYPACSAAQPGGLGGGAVRELEKGGTGISPLPLAMGGLLFILSYAAASRQAEQPAGHRAATLTGDRARLLDGRGGRAAAAVARGQPRARDVPPPVRDWPLAAGF